MRRYPGCLGLLSVGVEVVKTILLAIGVEVVHVNRVQVEEELGGDVLLLPCVHLGQTPGPVEYPPVGSHQPVDSSQRRSDDEAVGRVAVQVWQEAGADSDVAIHRDLDETVLKQAHSP